MFERLERPVQQAPRHHFIVPRNDDGKRVARGRKFAFEVLWHRMDSLGRHSP